MKSLHLIIGFLIIAGASAVSAQPMPSQNMTSPTYVKCVDSIEQNEKEKYASFDEERAKTSSINYDKFQSEVKNDNYTFVAISQEWINDQPKCDATLKNVLILFNVFDNLGKQRDVTVIVNPLSYQPVGIDVVSDIVTHGGVITIPSSHLSSISSSGNNVYLIWSDFSSSEKVYHTLFRASNDEGKNFGHILSMGNSFNGPIFSQIVSHDDNLYIALGSVLKKSTDGGHTFIDTIPINNETSGISNIVATENNIYVIEDHMINSGNSFEILFAASKDNGTTFGKPIKLFGMPESSEDYSQIAASSTNVYVVAEGEYGGLQGPSGVLYRASRDGGITFSDTIDLSENNSIDYAPKVATEGNNVYVAWSELSSDQKNSDLIFRVSTDSGETFGPKIKLNNDHNPSGTYNTDFIQLLAYDQIVYVKWWDVHFFSNGTESDHLMFKRMPGGDATIGRTIELTGNNARPIDIGHDSMISIGGDYGNKVYALWSEYSRLPNSQTSVFLKTSQDGGVSFGNAIDLNRQNNLSSGNGMINAQVIASRNNVYVASEIPSPGILFGVSTDDGKTFDGISDIDAEVIPEFPLAVPIMLIGIATLIIFQRTSFRN